MNEKVNFPKPPNWKKVETHTDEILKIINNNDLTFTEKNSILSIVRSSVDREFNISSVIMWLEMMYKDELTKSNKNPEHFQ